VKKTYENQSSRSGDNWSPSKEIMEGNIYSLVGNFGKQAKKLLQVILTASLIYATT